MAETAYETPVRKDPIIKGASRPAMKWGVPLMPLILAIALPAIVGVYAALFFNSLFILLFLISGPIILVMRAMTAKDDQQFRLLWLKWRFRFGRRASNLFWRAATYAPWSYRRETRSLIGNYENSPPIYISRGKK